MNRKELEAQMTSVLMPVAPHDWLIDRCCDLAELYARQQLLQQTQCTTSVFCEVAERYNTIKK